MFVNTDNLLRYLKGVMASSSTSEPVTAAGFVGGRCVSDAVPIRNPNSKWYASISSYPEAKFPAFCFGPSYVLSTSAAEAIFDASKDVPFFHLEDVYTTGLVGSGHLGIPPVSVPGMYNFRKPWNECFFKTKLIASHRHAPTEVRNLWRKVEASIRCTKMRLVLEWKW